MSRMRPSLPERPDQAEMGDARGPLELRRPIAEVTDPVALAEHLGPAVRNAPSGDDPVFAFAKDRLGREPATPAELVKVFNEAHPALHQSGRAATIIRDEVVITDLSAKRPSLPDDRYAVVKALADLSPSERIKLDDDISVARSAGRFSDWPSLMKAWDAADARKDKRTVVMCAATFVVFDELRKQMAQKQAAPMPPAPVAQAERPAPQPRREEPRREEPRREEPRREAPRREALPKVQASMLKRLKDLDAKERARLAKKPLPKAFDPAKARFPLDQAELLNVWQAFTRQSIERFKLAQVESPADNDDQMRFAAAYNALQGRPAKSAEEMTAATAKALSGDLSASATPTAPSAPAKAPSTWQAPAAAAAPAGPQQTQLARDVRLKALDQVMNRMKPEAVKDLIGPATLLFADGRHPDDVIAESKQRYQSLDKGDPQRAEAAQTMYAAALVSQIPDPTVTRMYGRDIFERSRQTNDAAEQGRAPQYADKGKVEALIQAAERQPSEIPMTPSLAHSRLRRQYAEAALAAVIAQTPQAEAVTKAAPSTADIQKLRTTAWLLAHAVVEAESRLPKTWDDHADDLLGN